MIFISVDLPAPFSPSTAWISPGLTRRWMSSLARTAGYCLVMPCSSRRSGGRGWGDMAGISAAIVSRRPPVPARARAPGADQIASVGQRHPGEQAVALGARDGLAARADRVAAPVPDGQVG